MSRAANSLRQKASSVRRRCTVTARWVVSVVGTPDFASQTLTHSMSQVTATLTADSTKHALPTLTINLYITMYSSA